MIAFDKITGDRDNSNELAQKTTSKIYIYLMFLARERALYQNLNRLNKSATSNQGYFWAPTRRIEEIKTKIGETKAEIEEFTDHIIPEPTYYDCPDFIGVWMLIVETYGIHSYQEANPAVVSIITFPFLFGMMFGDIGHGSILLIVGIVLTIMGDTLKASREWKDLAMVRYIFLLMGFFATYCGFIYNEFFAIPLSLFPTCY